MKKEYILSEAEKQQKKQKIEENRFRKNQKTLHRGGDAEEELEDSNSGGVASPTATRSGSLSPSHSNGSSGGTRQSPFFENIFFEKFEKSLPFFENIFFEKLKKSLPFFEKLKKSLPFFKKFEKISKTICFTN
jgi:hypothetical protein